MSALYRQYRSKFYLNARHSVHTAGGAGAIHPHTWELTFCMSGNDISKDAFSGIQKKLTEMLFGYQDSYLNSMQLFCRTEPTTENILRIFREEAQNLIKDDGLLLVYSEIKETPASAFCIDELAGTENPIFREKYRTTVFADAEHETSFAGFADRHRHTWELTAEFALTGRTSTGFAEVRRMADGAVAKYRGVFLNTLPDFGNRIPTAENICRTVSEDIRAAADRNGFSLLALAVSEDPKSTFCITF